MIHAKVQMVLGLAMCFGVSAMLVHVAVTDSSFDLEPASADAAMDQLPQGVFRTDSQSLDAKEQLQGDSVKKLLFSPAANSSLTSSLAGREVVSYEAFSPSHAPTGSAASSIVQPARPAGTVQESAAYLSSATYSSSTAVSGSSGTSGSFGSSGSSGLSGSSGSGGGGTSTAQASAAPASSSPARSGGSVYPAFQSPAAAESRFLSLDYIASSSFDIDEVLPLLEPLPKVHYFWPPPGEMRKDRENVQMSHLTRITHTQCVYGEYTNAREIDICVYRCVEVNRTEPDLPASLGINYSPWHRKFDASLPPTDRGPTYYEEIDYFTERALYVRQWVQDSNLKYGSDIRVTAWLLDSERFAWRADDQEWNQGMAEALDAIHEKAVEIFPDATIVWYGRGMTMFAKTTSCRLANWWTGEEQTQVLSCSLYNVPELDRMRLLFAATAEYGMQKGLSRIIPYLALAAGYERFPGGQVWRPDWRYDVQHSYAIGAELNLEGTGLPASLFPLSLAEAVIFYPPPFRETAVEWPRHFAAYVVGATQSIPE